MKKKLLFLSKILKTLKVVEFANLQFMLSKEPKPQCFGHNNGQNLDKTDNAFFDFFQRKLDSTIKKRVQSCGHAFAALHVGPNEMGQTGWPDLPGPVTPNPFYFFPCFLFQLMLLFKIMIIIIIFKLILILSFILFRKLFLNDDIFLLFV